MQGLGEPGGLGGGGGEGAQTMLLCESVQASSLALSLCGGSRKGGPRGCSFVTCCVLSVLQFSEARLEVAK